MPGDIFSKPSFLQKLAFLWAVKAFLDDANIEVTGWGPDGLVVTDRLTGEIISQGRQCRDS